MKMYHLWRRIHLFTGLVLLLFVLMYFVSGYIMIHAGWFGDRQPKVSVRKEMLNFNPNPSDPTLAERLQARLGLGGQSSGPQLGKDASVRFNFARPGTTFQVVLRPGTNEVTLTQKNFGVSGLANGLHRLHGYHGGWLYWMWALLYDLASAALIVFALTGLILWYQATTRHLAGWLCLAASFGFTAAMIGYLMLSK